MVTQRHPYENEHAIACIELRPHAKGGVVTRVISRPPVQGPAEPGKTIFLWYTLEPGIEPTVLPALPEATVVQLGR